MALDREGRAQVFRDQADRDRELEARYRLWCNGEAKAWEDKPCCASLLQHVVTHAEALLKEYMQWAHDNHAPHVFDSEMLQRWEVERFGDRAYPAAHAALLFTVKCAVFGSPYHRKQREERQPKLRPGLTDEQRKDAMLTALHKVAEDKAMPGRGML